MEVVIGVGQGASLVEAPRLAVGRRALDVDDTTISMGEDRVV
jgi:hypothetical protein